MKSRRQGKIIKASSVDDIMGKRKKVKRYGKIKRITLESQPMETAEEALISFIRKNKQVSYHMLQEYFAHVPETSLRAKIYALTRTGILKRERCLCGVGWIYQLNKK